eukprot:6364220-Pyramimonas_sp.AAC.1
MMLSSSAGLLSRFRLMIVPELTAGCGVVVMVVLEAGVCCWSSCIGMSVVLGVVVCRLGACDRERCSGVS